MYMPLEHISLIPWNRSNPLIWKKIVIFRLLPVALVRMVLQANIILFFKFSMSSGNGGIMQNVFARDDHVLTKKITSRKLYLASL